MKAGWKTSEFWVTATAIVALIAGSAATALTSINVVSPKWGAISLALSGAGYAVSRGLAKMFPPKEGT